MIIYAPNMQLNRPMLLFVCNNENAQLKLITNIK